MPLPYVPEVVLVADLPNTKVILLLAGEESTSNVDIEFQNGRVGLSEVPAAAKVIIVPFEQTNDVDFCRASPKDVEEVSPSVTPLVRCEQGLLREEGHIEHPLFHSGAVCPLRNLVLPRAGIEVSNGFGGARRQREVGMVG